MSQVHNVDSLEPITVVMPARNTEDTVIRAANSVIYDLSVNDTLVVCDDASDDTTWALLTRKYENNNKVRLLRNKRKLGVASTLNKMLEIVSTEFVGRMDADDISLPGRFKRQKKALSKNHFSFVGGLLHQRVLGAPALIPTSPFSIPNEAAPLALVCSNPFFHPGASFRLSALKKLGGYREVPGQDYDLWLRAAISGFDIEKISGWGVIYRRHAHQSSRAYGQKLAALNSQDPNLFALRTRLAKSLGLNGDDEESFRQEALMKLAQKDRLFRLKRWA